MDVAAIATDADLLHAELARRRWAQTHGDDWDLMWKFDLHDKATFTSVEPTQRLNHWPGAMTLHSKDELYYFLKRTADRVGVSDDRYDFFPRTFSMPGEYEPWRTAAAEEPGTIWIVKPKRLMGGQGIRIVTDLESVEADTHWIVQEYLADPFLLPGYPFKHILRLYVLVTSLDPLVGYLYGEGLVKFTSKPFGTGPDELADPSRHLTNNMVQLTNTTVSDPLRCIDLTDYRQKLSEAGHDPDRLWTRIRSLLAQTLIAHREPMLTLCQRADANGTSCFELFGFDVTVDAALKPWIIECNMSPGMGNRGEPGSTFAAVHQRVKEPMIADMFELIGAGERCFESAYGPTTFAAERRRRRGFDVLFPAADTQDLAGCFEATDADTELWHSL